MIDLDRDGPSHTSGSEKVLNHCANRLVPVERDERKRRQIAGCHCLESPKRVRTGHDALQLGGADVMGKRVAVLDWREHEPEIDAVVGYRFDNFVVEHRLDFDLHAGLVGAEPSDRRRGERIGKHGGRGHADETRLQPLQIFGKPADGLDGCQGTDDLR